MVASRTLSLLIAVVWAGFGLSGAAAQTPSPPPAITVADDPFGEQVTMTE